MPGQRAATPAQVLIRVATHGAANGPGCARDHGGLGSALIVDDLAVAMELGHLPRRKGRTYEDLLGKQVFKRLGKKKWRRKVCAVVRGFSDALLPDEIVVGDGQAERLKNLPPRTRRGDNADAFLGGFRLWGAPAPASSSAPHADPRRDEKAHNPGRS